MAENMKLDRIFVEKSRKKEVFGKIYDFINDRYGFGPTIAFVNYDKGSGKIYLKDKEGKLTDLQRFLSELAVMFNLTDEGYKAIRKEIAEMDGHILHMSKLVKMIMKAKVDFRDFVWFKDDKVIVIYNQKEDANDHNYGMQLISRPLYNRATRNDDFKQECLVKLKKMQDEADARKAKKAAKKAKRAQ